jgi:hypothetical protein
MEIIINDLDIKGDEKVVEFLEKNMSDPSILKEAEKKVCLETDKDFEELFIKFAEEFKPDSWSSLKEDVSEKFNGKLDDQFNRWENKMSIDKTRLKDLFGV